MAGPLQSDGSVMRKKIETLTERVIRLETALEIGLSRAAPAQTETSRNITRTK